MNLPATGIATVGSERSANCSVWLADLTYTQQALSSELIPAAVGGIASYCEANVLLEQPVRVFKYPEKLIAALESEGCPDIIGFSSYVWNSSLASAFARRIKETRPETIVIFGGPNYPTTGPEQESYLHAHDEFDFFIVKEGEVAFLLLVKALIESGFDRSAVHGKVGSVHSIDADGVAHLMSPTERLRDLTAIPSPYVTGKLDEFFDGKLLPIIQTNRGCPFSCTFCVEGTLYYNKIYTNAAEKVAAELEYIARKMHALREKGGRNDLFIADSNFGMYKDDLETCRAIARQQETYGWPDYINVATGKNQKKRVLEAARLINGALRLSGSVQSLTPAVLENIKRANISADDLMTLAVDAADVGANTYSELILGLPGESKVTHMETLRTVIDAGFSRVVPYQLMLLLGSDLCGAETKARFQMDVRYRVLPRCFGHYELFGRPLVSVEIEEVCVGTDTLSFDDYIDCRRMHLMIYLFFNDGAFSAALKFLRMLGLSAFRWMEVLLQTSPNAGIRSLFDEFDQATRSELWPDRAELVRYCHDPAIIQRYIDGELGRNLLFTFKTAAMVEFPEDLAELALRGTIQLLEESGRDSKENLAFLEDAIRFDLLRMTNVFDSQGEEDRIVMTHDILRFEAATGASSVHDFRLERPQTFRFFHLPKQQEMVERYTRLFGNTTVGRALIVSKVHFKKLLRMAEPVVAAAEERVKTAI